MYHPFIRQKIFEVRASELERIAEEDRIARAHAADAPARRFDWSRFGLGRRRAAVPRSVRVDAGTSPTEH
jgi:hypothetical protein